jgi:cold shock CspA family protein/ribosome-associated translation inhibitor RaiA
MQIPLEIAFHNVNHADWAESEIRARVAHLEAIYGRLISCRIRVDQRAASRSDAVPPVVRIEMGIPGRQDLVVAHEPEHLQRKFQRPDLRNAINEAFRIAERRLTEIKEQRQGRTKDPQHDDEHHFLGQIAELTRGQDFGFLLTKEGTLLYFHRNSLLAGDFDKLKRGDEVRYVEAMGDTGPTARKVWLLSSNGR